MKILQRLQPTARPRWDGNRILFEIEVDGRAVACAISRAALQELSGCHYIPSGDLLRRFAEGRTRIEALAAGIFAVRPESVTGTLNIWADDIDDPPPAPEAARQSTEVRA